MYRRTNAQRSPTKSLHSRRKRPPLVRPERATRLRFRTQDSLEEIHYIVHAPPAYHYSLDGFADEEVEENWEAEELTVPELRAALSKRRLPTSGRKMDLVERLSSALQQERTERRLDAAATAKRRKLDDILSAQQEEMEDRLEASNLEPSSTTATKHSNDDDTTTNPIATTTATTNFSFFFNTLATESPSTSALLCDDDDGDDPCSPHSSESPRDACGTSKKRKMPEADEGEENQKSKDDGERLTWGEEEEANGSEDGLVGRLTRFLEPSSPSRATSTAGRKPELFPEDLLPTSSSPVGAFSVTLTAANVALPAPSPPASPLRRPLKGVLKKREAKAPEDMTATELREHLIAYGVSGAALKQKKAAMVTLLRKRIEQHNRKASASSRGGL